MSSPSSNRPSMLMGIVTVVLTLTGWASVPLFLRHFAEQIDPWTSNGWRYGFSALLWLPVLIIAGLRHRMPPGLWKAALVPSVVNAAGQVCFTAAHYQIEPALLTFGLRCQLVFVAIGAWLLFPQERAIIRRPGYLAGAALLIVGMVVVLMLDVEDVPVPTAAGVTVVDHATVPGSPQAHGSGGGGQWGTAAAHTRGAFLAVGSGLLFACYGLSVRKYMAGVNSVMAFAMICQYTAAAMVMLMLVWGERYGLTVLDMTGEQIMWLLVSAVIGIAIGHVFYYLSIARLGVAVTAGVLQLQPFFVAFGSLPLFGERLTAGQWIGGSIAVAGAMLMLGTQWAVSRRERVSDAPLAVAEGESGS